MVFLNKYFTNIIHRQRFMKQQEIVKKIGVILKELQDQYQYIEKTKEPINDLELELFAANGNFLSDHIEILRKINGQAVKAQASKKSHITEKFFEPVIQPVRIPTPEKKEITPAEYADFEPAADVHEIELGLPAAQPAIEDPVDAEEHVAEEPVQSTTEEPVIKHELILNDIDYLDDDEDAVVNDEEIKIDHDAALRNIAERFGIPEFSTAKTESIAHFEDPEIPAHTAPEPEKPTYAQPEPEVTARSIEDFNKPPLTLNQILSAQLANATRLSEQQLSPIKDLRSAINLNDKMLYVKDLFNGYSLSYSEAIEILNRMDNFSDAEHFLRTNYVTKNRWEEKQATADKFYALLKRRFA